MKVEIEISPRAQGEIRRALVWWRANRPSAPDLLETEIRQAIDLLYEQPEIGTLRKEFRRENVRRLILTGTRHHLFYRYPGSKGQLQILSIWGSSRETPPQL